MKKKMSLAEILDDRFFELGGFTSLNKSTHFVFGKGGFCSEKKVESINHYFYVKEFYSSEFIYYYPEDLYTFEREEVFSEVNKFLDFELSLGKTRHFDELFAQDFDDLKESLNNHFKKAVLISSEWINTKRPDENKKRVFAKSILSGEGTPYGLWNNRYSVIGITPEILFERKGRNVETLALAGTARRGEDALILSSKKDRVEHDLVVQHILEELKPLSNQIEAGETRVSGFGNLIHLKTPINARLREEIQDAQLINQLSPTAALGGYPKFEALAFLKKTKYFAEFPHRFFGSVFGLNQDESHLGLVMIRNIQFKDESLVIESGAGIVFESELSKEMQEIILKREAIKELLL